MNFCFIKSFFYFLKFMSNYFIGIDLMFFSLHKSNRFSKKNLFKISKLLSTFKLSLDLNRIKLVDCL
ncbi:MAG: hypothetical protein CBC01_01510 [Betaproteobacteria bacterium TMED41]|nr:MAG: hypothetical protein CBC01_01510 [Betaproteobacteria bacterium TMED41]